MKKNKKKKHKKEVQAIWVEGHRRNEKTGKMEPVKFKLKRSCW